MMLFVKRSKAVLFLLIFFATLFISSTPFSAQNEIHLITLNDDTINPVTADYIIGAIEQAQKDDVQCLIIQLDTPGGLLNSTRLIVKHMLTAQVPIVVYIAPNGSRAGSAGVFITYASHIAAMAPSTNIGAAHPVKMGDNKPKRSGDWKELRKIIDELKNLKDSTLAGEKKKSEQKKDIKETEPEEGPSEENPMESKILNDTVAFIKSIAKERNRNEEWAIKSVTESASITHHDAFEKKVVEIVAINHEDLLDQLDGRTVTINGKEITLATKNAVIKEISMDARQSFFNILANPNIAYFLMILGFYGLLYEITHPGIGVPGIMGAIFLILALYAMQSLPTNYAGLALMVLGLLLLIAEAYIPGFGLLTLGGVVCMVLGSMLLFESVDPIMRVSYSAILGFSLTTAAITLFLVRSVIHSYKSKAHGGKEGIIGETGEAQSTFKAGQNGKVFVHGELWNATADTNIIKGEEVIVTQIKGLKIKVERKASATS